MRGFKTLSLLCLSILILSLQYCRDEVAPIKDARKLAPLVQVRGDCSDVASIIKNRAIQQMEETLDRMMEDYLEFGCRDCCFMDGLELDAGVMYGEEDDSEAESEGNNEEGAEEYTETNTQVEGVDEADFVKNDGSYIYILANGKFFIIDAWPPENSHIVSSITIEGTPRKMFVTEDRALIYSSLGYNSYYRECTYGYDCDFTGDGFPFKVFIYDISNKTEPQLVRELEFSHTYLNSRRIGSTVYTIAYFGGPRFEIDLSLPEELEEACYNEEPILDPLRVQELFEEKKARNREAILRTEINNIVPSIIVRTYDRRGSLITEEIINDCSNTYVNGFTDGTSFITIAGINMVESGGDINLTTIIGRPGAVYASHESIYIASRHLSGGDYGWEFEGGHYFSDVHKFEIEPQQVAVRYVASGVVKGHVLSQFSMDEYEGYLRIATTSGHVPDPDVHSTVLVLEEGGGVLNVVGQVDQIAPGEDIRAVRFDGEKGYVVTFKKTDPLFVLDLSDPYSPMLVGELHIPGFSTYMHKMDDTHLIALGYDADDMGDFAWFDGILLQIFDVSDITNPVLLHREVIGTRGSTSDATTDHLAFTYFRQRNLLALPIIICEGGGNGIYGDRMTFSGLLVYRVTLSNGFEELGRISHEAPSDQYNCYNWWTESNSQVKRSIFMEDYVFSIALDKIKVVNINDFSRVLSEIDLTH